MFRFTYFYILYHNRDTPGTYLHPFTHITISKILFLVTESSKVTELDG